MKNLELTDTEFETVLDALAWASDETSAVRYEELLKKLQKLNSYADPS